MRGSPLIIRAGRAFVGTLTKRGLARRCVLASFATLTFSVPLAAAPVATAADLPTSVKLLYQRLCPSDNWIGNKPILDGSASQSLPDGTQVFLLVCGDAASSTPFDAILMSPAGEARKAPMTWILNGKSLGDGDLADARFGSGGGTIVSHTHVSATCEPTYIHRWDGQVFRLVSRTTRGCKRGDL